MPPTFNARTRAQLDRILPFLRWRRQVSRDTLRADLIAGLVGAVDHVQQNLQEIDEHDPRQTHVLIVASGINFVDMAGAGMLAQEARRRRALGGGLYFYRVKDAVRALLERGGYLADIGAHNLFPVKTHPIEAIYPRLDSNVCRSCRARIFRQCHIVLPNGEPRTAPA